MSATDETNDQTSGVYGGILASSIYQSPRSELPSIGSFLSQGAALGPLLAFLWPVMGMLWHPDNGYNFLLISYLPVILLGGMFFGLCEGAMIWAGTYLVGRRINFVIRAIMGIVILVLLFRAYAFLFAEPAPAYHDVPRTEYLSVMGTLVASGVIFGLVIGSRFQPWSELLRGTTTDQWPVLNGLTGLLLRLFVILSLMISILSLILSLQGDFHPTEFGFSLVAVGHFAVAAFIVFARMPFWLLLMLALVINFPIVTLLTDVLKPEEIGLRTVTLNYLALWAAFLSCRWTMPSLALGRRLKAR